MKLDGSGQSALHGLGGNLGISTLKLENQPALPLLKGEGELLNGYSHGIGGIGPLGGGLYRYAPSVSPLLAQSASPTAYLKAQPTLKIQPAVIKTIPEKHYEHYVCTVRKYIDFVIQYQLFHKFYRVTMQDMPSSMVSTILIPAISNIKRKSVTVML